MAPRRPSSATDADSRLPFASAEALLWGPEMKQQHAHLLTEMRALQKHHEAYDSRIRNTEHVAKSAEAATSRVRHLEQQLAAIEAEDDDKAFEKWAAGEMTRLGIFIDTNKHVRQKQIELDNIVSHAVEDIDKLRSVPRELKVVLRRLDLLEAGHNHDAQKIKSLQEEVARLKSIRQGSAPNTAGLSTISRPQHGILRPMTPSKLLNAEILDVTSETDDEDLMLLRTFPHEEIQVPQSPETRAKESDSATASAVNPGHPVKSARQRLMQRPSIHDSMLSSIAEGQRQVRAPAPRPGEPVYTSPVATQRVQHIRQSREPAPNPAPVQVSISSRVSRPRARIAPPPTQLINKASPRKRKQPTKEPQTQRLTRAQAKKAREQEAEEQKPHVTGSDSHLPPTQLVEPAFASRKKQKTTHDQGPDHVEARSSAATRTAGRSPATTKRNAAACSSKNTASEPTQLVTRSPAKSNIPKATTSPVRKRNPVPVRPNAAGEPKQKSLIVVLRSPQKATGVALIEKDDVETTAAGRVKAPLRKAAAPLSRFKAIPKPLSTHNTTGRNKLAVGTGGSSTNRNSIGTKPETTENDAF